MKLELTATKKISEIETTTGHECLFTSMASATDFKYYWNIDLSRHTRKFRHKSLQNQMTLTEKY